MKLNWFKTLSLVAAFAVLMTTGTAAFAKGGKEKRLEANESHTAKVWIYNAQPGDVIAAFQFAFSGDATRDVGNDHNASPEGSLLESTTVVPANGQLEVFVPILMPSVIYSWSESKGYRFLGQIAPSDSDAKPMLDAAGK